MITTANAISRAQQISMRASADKDSMELAKLVIELARMLDNALLRVSALEDAVRFIRRDYPQT